MGRHQEKMQQNQWHDHAAPQQFTMPHRSKALPHRSKGVTDGKVHPTDGKVHRWKRSGRRGHTPGGGVRAGFHHPTDGKGHRRRG